MSPDYRPSSDRPRREFLTKCGIGLVTALSTATAGCTSDLPPLGSQQRYGRVAVPPADAPEYRQWIPSPATLDAPVEQYYFGVLRPKDIPLDAPELVVARRAHAKTDLDYFGIGFENYDRLVTSSVGTVVEANFDRATVRQTITDSGYERSGEHRGYAVFSRSDVPRRVAVGDGVVVWTSEYRHAAPNLEALIDAGKGERPRYHEENAAVERLTSKAGGNAYLGVSTAIRGPADRPVMRADAFRFDDDTAYQVIHYLYEKTRVPTKSVLKSALKREEYRFADEADGFDVQFDGRLATVETRVPLRSTDRLDPEYQLPQVTWGTTYDRETESVTIRHEAGESVPAGRLFYDVDRPSRPGRIDERQLWTGTDTVAGGAETTIDLNGHPNATDVNLVYSTGGVSFHVLFGLDLRGDADE
ncbi:hypothetical protein M0R88_11925 [Halorussus gelatinilyticus]|uniref:Uncharacterized protein n=1 Tax=Halorussus gelatinilyticus TaxID=2937524 RepID=A0A8U0IG32_9EURY|nr:hypothetical protein [Halorussus gelatinilyticus]UPV99233.1 hypothetical protein M0R88_11925 [Halorussus gelatinilyticus]